MDHYSTHEENEPLSQSLVPWETWPSFILREEPIANNGTLSNSMEEIAQMYAILDPNLWQLIPFKEYHESKLMENRKKHHVDEDLQKKVNKVKLPCFNGLGEETTQSWVQKLDTYLSYSPMTEDGVVKCAYFIKIISPQMVALWPSFTRAQNNYLL